MKVWLQIIAYSFFLVSLSQCASFQKENHMEKEIWRTQQLIEKSQNLTWPPFDLREYNFWLVSNEYQLLKQFKNGKITSLSYYQFKQQIPQIPFMHQLIELNNEKILLINVDHPSVQKKNEIAQNLLNKGFFTFYQNNSSLWQQSLTAPTPILYPFLERPRLYRRLMLSALKDFLHTKDKKHLQAFSWWYHKWAKEFPIEALSSTDRYAGSAQYYTFKQLHSNAPSSKDAFSFYKSREFSKENFNEEFFDLLNESQFLGFLSGLILDELEKNPKNWKKLVASGLSPLEVLAKKSKAKKQILQPSQQREYLHISVRKMHQLQQNEQLDQSIKSLANFKNIKVILNEKNFLKEAPLIKDQYHSFFNFIGMTDIKLHTLNSVVKLKSSLVTFNLDSTSIWISAYKTPCHNSSNSTVLTFSASAITENKDGTLTIDGQHILKNQFKKKKYRHNTFYCLN